jgi:hypothetical protein
MGMGMGAENPVHPVGLPGVPAIRWGTPRPHGDRGPCVDCHTVTMGNGRPMPNIQSFSSMPHEFRGVCNNCHRIDGSPTGNPVAAVRPVIGEMQMIPGAGVPQNMMGAQGPMGAAGLAAGPREADWRGLEVRPSPTGVTVTKAEGAAGRSGLARGDVLVSLNASPIQTVADFVQATQNGRLNSGTMIVMRDGQRMAFELTAPPATGLPAPGNLMDPAGNQAMPRQQVAPMNQNAWGVSL